MAGAARRARRVQLAPAKPAPAPTAGTRRRLPRRAASAHRSRPRRSRRPSCWPPWPRLRLSSTPIARTATSRRVSTRWARSRSATPSSTRPPPSAHARARQPDPRGAARPPCSRRDARRGTAAARGDVLRDDGVRDRAHLRPRGATVAALGDRVRPVPPTARAGGDAAAFSSGCRPSRRSSSTSAARSSARNSSRSKGWTRWCRCSTSRSSSPLRQGAHGAVIGMAHRGRLSVLAHTLGQPYEAILREFEGERAYRTPSSATRRVAPAT